MTITRNFERNTIWIMLQLMSLKTTTTKMKRCHRGEGPPEVEVLRVRPAGKELKERADPADPADHRKRRKKTPRISKMNSWSHQDKELMAILRYL